jgi:hypothetical protein
MEDGRVTALDSATATHTTACRCHHHYYTPQRRVATLPSRRISSNTVHVVDYAAYEHNHTHILAFWAYHIIASIVAIYHERVDDNVGRNGNLLFGICCYGHT